MFNNDKFIRVRNFYRRNTVSLLSVGLVVFAHLFWWQIQQNPSLVPPSERKRNIGFIKIPYIDELDYFNKNNKKEDK